MGKKSLGAVFFDISLTVEDKDTYFADVQLHGVLHKHLVAVIIGRLHAVTRYSEDKVRTFGQRCFIDRYLYAATVGKELSRSCGNCVLVHCKNDAVGLYQLSFALLRAAVVFFVEDKIYYLFTVFVKGTVFFYHFLLNIGENILFFQNIFIIKFS